MHAGAEVHIKEWLSLFRCNGSDAYIAWLDNVLDISEIDNPTLNVADYDFQVIILPTSYGNSSIRRAS